MQYSDVVSEGEKSVARPQLDRRNFLILGAAGLAVPLFTQAAAAQEKLAAAGGALPMSIGFVEGTDEAGARFSTRKTWRKAIAAAGEGEMPRRVVPARSLIIGDQNLANQSVRLSIRGLYPRVPALSALVSADLDVLFPSPDPAADAPVPFYAWSYRQRPVSSPSPPLSFVAPLGVDGRLDLSLKVRSTGARLAERVVRGAPEKQQVYRTAFTVDGIEGRPKLLPGLYLLGLTPVWETEVDLPKAGDKPNMNLLSIVLAVEPGPEE